VQHMAQPRRGPENDRHRSIRLYSGDFSGRTILNAGAPPGPALCSWS
jgi:hypothetical protein